MVIGMTDMATTEFRIFWLEDHPKKKHGAKKVFHQGTFATRQKAKAWCRNNSWRCPWIMHPDGTQERHVPNQD